MTRVTRDAECSDNASTVRPNPPESRASTFPNLQRLLNSNAFEDFVPLLPAPLLDLPRVGAARGHRIRQRQSHQRAVCLEANIIIKHLNALDCGICKERTTTRCAAAKHKVYTDCTALERFVHRIKRLAAIAVLERRDLAFGQSSGAHATASLVKADIADRYTFKVRQHNQIPLMAHCIDEPNADWPSVDMLSALPPHERDYYSHEHNVVETEGKDHEEFKALEKQYGFVGGTYDEYTKYFQRTDCDQGLWHFVDGSEVRATAGFSVVPKKAEGRQRKLLMQVPANYYWQDASARSNLGMLGGGGLASLYAPGGDWAVATFDQSNAFTAVRTPRWMWGWVAAPPLRAADVWQRLGASLRRRCNPMSWVFPLYTRLAMGSSHSVHILMSINLEHVGRALRQSSRLPMLKPNATEEVEGTVRPPEPVDSDTEWAGRHCEKCERTEYVPEERAWSLAGWCEAVRAASRGSTRTFVVMHLFSGARRPGDLEEFFRQAAKRAGIALLMLSVDLADDPLWDLTLAATFDTLRQLVCEGLIDVIIAGPPCSTWSRLRFMPGGPRPLRLRSHPWGGRDYTPWSGCASAKATTR